MKNNLVILVTLFLCSAINAQISLGADFVSRYEWRGSQIGNGASLQPYLEYAIGDLTIGAWGAYSLTDDGSNEIDLYATYKVLDFFTVGLTDYYVPTEGSKLPNDNAFDYSRNDNRQHTLEASLSVDHIGSFPISFLYAINLDTDHDMYFELAYPLTVEDVELSFVLGAGLNDDESGFYLTGDQDFGIVRVGVTASKEIAITNNFSLPISVSYIVNPSINDAYLVFGISL